MLKNLLETLLATPKARESARLRRAALRSFPGAEYVKVNADGTVTVSEPNSGVIGGFVAVSYEVHQHANHRTSFRRC